QPRGIAYVQGDAQRLDGVGDAGFDGVVCKMALMDIPDLGATARTVARILRPGGWFVFSITHPMLDTALGRARLVRDATGESDDTRSYFAEGPWRAETGGVRGRVGAHHRTLSTYVNTLVAAGACVVKAGPLPAGSEGKDVERVSGGGAGALRRGGSEPQPHLRSGRRAARRRGRARLLLRPGGGFRRRVRRALPPGAPGGE